MMDQQQVLSSRYAAIERAFPGVVVEEFDARVDEDQGEVSLWLKLRAPEQILVEQGIVTPELLASIKHGNVVATREGLRITRRKHWARVHAHLLDAVCRQGPARDRLEGRVLTALLALWWDGPKPAHRLLSH